MLLNNIEELNGCIRDNIPCKFLVATFSLKPVNAICTMRNECGRGYCCYHLDNDEGLTVEEMIKLECK